MVHFLSNSPHSKVSLSNDVGTDNKTFHFFLYENVPTYSMTLKNPFQMIGHFYTDVMRFLRHPKSFAFTEHEYHLVHVIEFKSGE